MSRNEYCHQYCRYSLFSIKYNLVFKSDDDSRRNYVGQPSGHIIVSKRMLFLKKGGKSN